MITRASTIAVAAALAALLGQAPGCAHGDATPETGEVGTPTETEETEIEPSERVATIIGFPAGSARLGDEQRERLEGIANWMTRDPDNAVALVAHFNSFEKGPPAHDLARKRADEIRAALTASGGDPGKIKLLPLGSRDDGVGIEEREGHYTVVFTTRE